jgi:hypothetical protein
MRCINGLPNTAHSMPAFDRIETHGIITILRLGG